MAKSVRANCCATFRRFGPKRRGKIGKGAIFDLAKRTFFLFSRALWITLRVSTINTIMLYKMVAKMRYTNWNRSRTLRIFSIWKYFQWHVMTLFICDYFARWKKFIKIGIISIITFFFCRLSEVGLMLVRWYRLVFKLKCIFILLLVSRWMLNYIC